MGSALMKAAVSQEVEIWPELWPVFRLFCDLQTQWFVGMAGQTGLRYEALYPLLDRMTTTPEAWREWFEDVQHMEGVALKTMRENQS
jgi:hypothetical protein